MKRTSNIYWHGAHALIRASLLEAKRVNDQMLAQFDYGLDA